MDNQDAGLQLYPTPQAGKTMAKGDALSQRAGHDQGKADNEDTTVLKSEWFKMISIDTDQDILNRIKKIHHNHDKSVLKTLAQKETN